MYYNVDYFRKRVERIVLPPSKLYWRVRAVFELYGNKCDSKTGLPLFNKAAWKKANNLLQEILAGNASDPPGCLFYQQQLNAKGEPAFDELGFPLLDCNRGTNDTECVHKQILTTFGTWCTGMEMSDALMAERRHRYNQHVSERRRLGFPKLGHSDTWLIDSLQLLVEHNHGVLLYPDWSNTSDYVTTEESFGTVPLQTPELTEAIEAQVAKFSKPPKLTPDQEYQCKVMKTKLPLLPVHGEEECKLFRSLVMRMQSLDFDLMAMEWVKFTDGITIFPKLPVYLRTHYKAWQRNQRVRDAVRVAATGKERLRMLNAATAPLTAPAGPTIAAIAAAISAAPVGGAASASAISPSLAGSGNRAAEPVAHATSTRAVGSFSLPPQHPMMPRLSVLMPRPVTQPIVGGTFIGGAPSQPLSEKRKHGDRGKDQSKRKERRCGLCKQHNDERAMVCNGKHPRGHCQWHTPSDAVPGAG